jgi:hypothetical protein
LRFIKAPPECWYTDGDSAAALSGFFLLLGKILTVKRAPRHSVGGQLDNRSREAHRLPESPDLHRRALW